jgi:hypothetical protein
MDDLESSLAASGADVRPLHGLRSLLAIDTSAVTPTPNVAPTAPTTFGGLRALADKVAARGVSAVAAGLKTMMPSKRDTPITRAASQLMDNRPPAADEESFGYIDPKVGNTDGAGAAAGRTRGAFSSAIVFVVGPGNYLEYMTLRERSRAHASPQGAPGRSVIYGCTELLSATGFAAQLAPLAPVAAPR